MSAPPAAAAPKPPAPGAAAAAAATAAKPAAGGEEKKHKRARVDGDLAKHAKVGADANALVARLSAFDGARAAAEKSKASLNEKVKVAGGWAEVLRLPATRHNLTALNKVLALDEQHRKLIGEAEEALAELIESADIARCERQLKERKERRAAAAEKK